MNIWNQPADGSGVPRQLTRLEGGNVHVDAWSADGQTLAFHWHQSSTQNLFTLSLDGPDAAPEGFLEREFADESATFSPDGRYVAFVSTETGQREVFIRPFPGPGGQSPVSVGGGTEPLWAPNGELFYLRPGDAMMMVVRVATDPTLRVGPPTELFRRGPVPAGSRRRRYDVTADGQRFLLPANHLRSGDADSETSAQVPTQNAAQIHVVLNWFQELTERVPTDQ